MSRTHPDDPAHTLVIDTSIFVNPDTQALLGPSVDAAVEGFLEIAREQHLHIYIPTSIFREMRHFVSPSTLDKLRTYATVRAPDLFSLHIPAAVLHFFIRDVRQRIDRGLRVAEQAARAESSDETLRHLRKKYREVVRAGIVDSVEDLDVVLLAKEINGTILTADEGIRNMAQVLGIQVLSVREFLLKFAHIPLNLKSTPDAE